MVLACVLAVLRRPHRVVVQGPSMIPTLDEGDRLVVWRSNRLRLGDLVVVVDPHFTGRLLVKRIVGLGDGSLVLGGDNSGVSRDSRSFGAVPLASVLGVARFRYHPADQRRRLSRPSRGAPAIAVPRGFAAHCPYGKGLAH
jgi:nickel-type superoxide dismutase maturation protease